MARKKYELNEIDRFVIKAREQGLTYAQLQVRETCEKIKKNELTVRKRDK